MAHKDIDKYENEPVYYCNGCLSLKVKSESGIDYCGNCGSTDITTSSMKIWKERYRRKYGTDYIVGRQEKFDNDEL